MSQQRLQLNKNRKKEVILMISMGLIGLAMFYLVIKFSYKYYISLGVPQHFLGF